MARDEDEDDGLPPMGENTDKFLDQAKKGQARNFLLVCKGNKVNYLAVRKKPIKKNELNEAKKAGYKGEGYFGVITGQGMELSFNLSMADGYTTEPVKDKILKDFLEEKVGFKSKPTIVLVETLPEVPFDDEDLKNPLVARFLALGELIVQVLDANPDAEAELKKTTSEIRGLLQESEFDSAEPLINALETRLKELLDGTAGVSPSPTVEKTQESTTPKPQLDNDALKQKLQDALNKLVPQLKEAVVKYPEKKVELLTPVASIKKQLEANDLQTARAGILDLGAMLKSLGSGTVPNSTVDPLHAEYDAKLAEIQPLYEQALQRSLGDTSKFRAVMAYVLEQGEAGVYANAIKALDRLRTALDLALQPEGTGGDKQTEEESEGDEGDDGDEEVEPVSIFKLGKARIEWQGTRLMALRELQRLRNLLLEEYADDADSTQALNETFAHLDFIINSLNEELGERLDDILNADAPERIGLIPAAKTVLERFVTFVDTDQTLQLIDGNEYAPEMVVAKPVKEKLDAISNALAANA